MLYPLWRLTIYTLQSALLFNFFKDASMLTVLLPNTTLVKINEAQRKHLSCCYRSIDIQLLIAGVRRLNKRWRREQFITLQYRIRATECITLCCGKVSIKWSENALELNWFWTHSLGSPAVREESSFVEYRGRPTLSFLNINDQSKK